MEKQRQDISLAVGEIASFGINCPLQIGKLRLIDISSLDAKLRKLFGRMQSSNACVLYLIDGNHAEGHDLICISHSATGTTEAEISPVSPVVSGSPSEEPIFSKLGTGGHVLRGA